MHRTKGLFVCLSVCLSVCLFPTNVKTTKSFGPNFFLWYRMIPGKVYAPKETHIDNQYFSKCANLNRKIRQHLRIIKNGHFQSYSLKLRFYYTKRPYIALDYIKNFI